MKGFILQFSLTLVAGCIILFSITVLVYAEDSGIGQPVPCWQCDPGSANEGCGANTSPVLDAGVYYCADSQGNESGKVRMLSLCL